MVKKKSKDMDDGMCEVIIQSMFKRRFKVYVGILNTKLLNTSIFRKNTVTYWGFEISTSQYAKILSILGVVKF